MSKLIKCCEICDYFKHMYKNTGRCVQKRFGRVIGLITIDKGCTKFKRK